LSLNTNGFQFPISGANGSGPVIIYASTNLIGWESIFTNAATNGIIWFLDPDATNLSARFYKAMEK
jgi:hypothetical protein